jgi:hypothetical protein
MAVESHFHVIYNHETGQYSLEAGTEWSATSDSSGIFDTEDGEWLWPPAYDPVWNMDTDAAIDLQERLGIK